CCLAAGSTEATMVGTLHTLKPGAVLIFEEVIGPETGDPDDANPANRWAVMLTHVKTHDYKGQKLKDPLNGTFITQIRWATADALPFPLCLSSTTDVEHGQKAVFNVSVARGNIVPADQGLWIPAPENLGEVPTAVIPLAVEDTCACGSTSPVDAPRPFYYPQLANSPLTFALPFDNSAASVFLNPPSFGSATPAPQITVTDDLSNNWPVLDDLLSLDGNQKGCVVEIEFNGSVFVRFGDGQYGSAPPPGANFQAYYRVGNGAVGNVGHDTLAHAYTSVPGIALIRNPLAAAGGVDPETMQHIQQTAPFAFLTQLRAVTEDDYGTMAAQDPAIRAARGTLRWTGSWYTAFVSIESVAENLPASLVKSTEKRLNLLRMMGTDLDAEAAWIVGLRIEMEVCVDLDHFQGDVEAAIEKLLITGNQCGGQPGILNADNFTFGQTIYASPIVAAVQGVEGVSSVTLTVFQRMDDPSIDGAAQGWLTMGRLEIARCDNDPNRIDHGLLKLHMDGGK
ncbi:MAG: putative baseplate assembly protein, partial [Opitutaceae bacterium]